MPLETDPFTKVFDACWALVDASLPVSGLVREGNKIRFNLEQNRDTVKLEIVTADLPELILIPEGTAKVNLHQSTCASTITMQYKWLLSTGDYRVQQFLNPVNFALLCAMANYPSQLMGLQWNGNNFVRLVNVGNMSSGQSNSELNRGIHGWSSMWAFSVDMLFATGDLQNFNTIDPNP